jgi:hypothetical protein
MTIEKETLIYCDEENCPRKGVPLGNGDVRHQSASEQLHDSGWLVMGKKHYCPECQTRDAKGKVKKC